MMDLVDPTISSVREHIDYAPRPKDFKGLRVGLVENSKKNSEELLCSLADKLRATYDMKMEVLLHKPQRAPLTDAQLAALKGAVDFVVTGVGD
jgi:hypothetical protein